METCSSCGATLAPDAQWCGQCLTPIKQNQEQEMSVFRRSRMNVEAPSLEGMEYSRWKGGPTSFGPVGRSLLTVGLCIGVFVGYFIAQGGMVVTVGVEIPAPLSYVMYAVIAIPLAVWGLKTIWKRARIK